MSPSVAIVILNWNGRPYLQRFLPSVLATEYDNYEVIIADNGSTDDSVVFLREQYPGLRIILLKENGGFATGYNLALQQVKAEYYVLLNSDVEVTPGWMVPVIDLMESDEQIGACQPTIRMESRRNFFEYAGAAGGWMDALGYPFARGRVFDNCEEDHGQYNEVADIFWASGAAMFVRSAVYHHCGGLDDFFFAHMEEIDLCWRIQRAGYRVLACPQAVVYHVGGGTLPKGNERKVYLNFRNNLVMLSKNLPPGRLVWTMPLRLMLDIVSAWKALLTGDGRYFRAVMRAHLGWLRWLLKRDRNPGPVLPKRVALTGWLNRSVVWWYFVKGKQKFSEIVPHKPVKYKQ